MPGIEKTYKTLAPKERAKREKELALLERERPEIEAWANAALDRLEAIDEVVAVLRAARIAKGISLSQVEEASGLGRSNVSRLENDPSPNPKLETLMTYAQAIGVELRVAVIDQASGRPVARHTAAHTKEAA